MLHQKSGLPPCHPVAASAGQHVSPMPEPVAAVAQSRLSARFSAALLKPRPLWLLLLLSLAIGFAHAFSLLPLSLVAGSSAFWHFPRGVVDGGLDDMADALVGYLYFVPTGWHFPLLQAPLLGAPAGTNIFWLDAVPIVALLGKLLHSAIGATVNLLGIYALMCFALPGTAMTALLAALGERSLIATLAGSVIADTSPFLLYRWGHLALSGQFLVIFGLALYFWTVACPIRRRIDLCWTVFLVLVSLINLYLFAMVGCLWAAALLQRRENGDIAVRGVLARGVVAIGCVLLAMLVTGEINRELASAATLGFGYFSMNLLSPFVPQMSGLVPPLAHYRAGMPLQYEGFAYLGFGVLLLLLLNLPWLPRAFRQGARSHPVLFGLLGVLCLFALSNRVYFGNWLLLDIPLPTKVEMALGAFRSSGRFFWPIGYAIMAAMILLTLRRFSPRLAMPALAVAAMLQFADVTPFRHAIAQTAMTPRPPVFDDVRLAALIADSRGVMVFPPYLCTPRSPDAARLTHENMEIQLAAARALVPINSVYTSHVMPDCAAEQTHERAPLRPHTLYVYLEGFVPSPEQLSGASAASVCTMMKDARFCQIPSPVAVTPPQGEPARAFRNEPQADSVR